ncbi:autotransporter outer membrane beta-barrel domain-containing protein [Klebsiella quasipneumoniae]|nr:autotransporter outer membrane beta-barrel domain-containing protein [Klebsiella quasipneumoniae]MCD7988443.1 autotransporter outer membrane beta-barrel domain-containing protein [Klebsiella quasipneumoniae]MEB5998003.1 autotransporter outer membrane beta-barrel domain-containing protein [Klebsiella quasipneumoniae]
MGVDGNLSRNVSIWSNVGQQVGDKGYSDTGVTLGLESPRV